MIKKLIKRNIFWTILFLIFIILFLFIKNNYSDKILLFDKKVIMFFKYNIVSKENTALFKYITLFGSAWVLCGIILLLFFIFRLTKLPIFISLGLIFSYACNSIVKWIFKRPRPIEHLVALPSGYSFVSGHTMCSTVVYGLFTYFICSEVKNVFLKWTICFIFSMLIVFIGLSRIYLNVHYFTDVICGLILGLICLIIIINIYKIIKESNENERKI